MSLSFMRLTACICRLICLAVSQPQPPRLAPHLPDLVCWIKREGGVSIQRISYLHRANPSRHRPNHSPSSRSDGSLKKQFTSIFLFHIHSLHTVPVWSYMAPKV